MLPSFARDVVTVYRAPLIESRGTQIRDWNNATSHTVAGCSFQPTSTATTWADERHTHDIRASLWLPPGADIEAEDKVEYEGHTYAIDGAPLPWKSPTGLVDHVVANLIDWRG